MTWCYAVGRLRTERHSPVASCDSAEVMLGYLPPVVMRMAPGGWRPCSRSVSAAIARSGDRVVSADGSWVPALHCARGDVSVSCAGCLDRPMEGV